MRHPLFLLLSLFVACQGTAGPKVQWQEWDGNVPSQSRPFLFYFDAKWCPYCTRLEETVFKDNAVIELSKQFLMMKVDGDRDVSDGVMKKYGVQGYPTLIFAKKDGAPLAAWLSDPDPRKFAALIMTVAERLEPHSSWQEYRDGKLKSVDMEEDPYWMEAENLEQKGKGVEAKEVYRRGGLALLEKINKADSLQQEKSLLSGTIALLIKGEVFKEAQSLALRSIEIFPDDFLYYHRLATAYKEDGKPKEAVEMQQKAFEKSHGRNRTWVGYQLAELLLAQSELSKAKAKAVIGESLQSVHWETNTRQKELKFKEKLETLLKSVH